MKTRNELFFALFCLALVPLSCHWLYSSYGFNPTDEGFVLGYAKRVWGGEIPHVDFISIRPALSAYLHVPEIALTKENVLLFSRLISWVEFALIVFFWQRILLGKQNLGWPSRIVTFLLAYLLTFNNYPPMAWHTVDGIALCTLGIFLFLKLPTQWKVAGAFLLGLAYLCKQNFTLVGPLVILLQSKPRSWIKHFIVWLLPAVMYALFIGAYGGIDEMLVQFKSETSLLKTGILAYTKSVGFLLGITSGIAFSVISDKWTILAIWGKWILFASLIALGSYGLYKGSFFWQPSFFIFGLASGLILPGYRKKTFSIHLVALFLGWSASVSIGLNTPVLVICSAIFIIQTQLFKREHEQKIPFHWVLAAGLVPVLICFHIGRTHHIYRDLDAKRLTYHLGDVLKGANGIYTNKRNWDLHADLQEISDTAQIALLPYSGAFWACSDKKNPTLIHWTSGIELQNPRVQKRFVEQLEEQRGKTAILISKYFIPDIASGRYELKIDARVPVIQHFVKHWELKDETPYFFIYR